MGTQGQVPKRSEERRRNNPPAIPIKTAIAHRAEPPASNAKWHPIARRWYKSLALSGQSRFYEASDWMLAYLCAESMSRDLFPRYVAMQTFEDGSQRPLYAAVPLSGPALTSYLRAMVALVSTEGDRRRAGIELVSDNVDTDEVDADNELLAFKARRSS